MKSRRKLQLTLPRLDYSPLVSKLPPRFKFKHEIDKYGQEMRRNQRKNVNVEVISSQHETRIENLSTPPRLDSLPLKFKTSASTQTTDMKSVEKLLSTNDIHWTSVGVLTLIALHVPPSHVPRK